MAQVKLILTEDVPSLGEAGDVVNVKPGFARNFLLPQGKAVPATDAKVKEIEHHKRVIAERVARERKQLEGERERLERVELEIAANAGEEGKLFGSVTSAQVAELLEARGFSIDRRKIQLDEPIKELGDHVVAVRLHRDVVARVRIKVSAAP
ncbi:MAG TPA: 50S ribosomal protein L9 [Myxococcota bacterium]|nr:50S ribosomal protein L9 [Myxococcota bacterium]